jgi:hypothetical protein
MTGNSQKKMNIAEQSRKAAGRLAEDIFTSLGIDKNATEILKMLREGKEKPCSTEEK